MILTDWRKAYRQQRARHNKTSPYKRALVFGELIVEVFLTKYLHE